MSDDGFERMKATGMVREGRSVGEALARIERQAAPRPARKPQKKPTDMPPVIAAAVREGFPEPEKEFRFTKLRQWRFDFAWPEYKVALEREGGDFKPTWCPQCNHRKVVFVSRHHSKDGLEADAEKYNAAAVLGWMVIRATPGMVKDGRALSALLGALRARRDAWGEQKPRQPKLWGDR